MEPLRPPVRKMPEAFNEHDFNYSKFNKCVNFIGKNVLCHVTKEMFIHKSAECEDGAMLLSVYLETVQGWSKRKIKDKVTKLHSPHLDVQIKSIDIDISFAGTIITEAFPDIYSKLSDSCKVNINVLRKLRNNVCHHYGICADELDLEIGKLGKILKEIYKDVGKTLGKDFSNNIKDVKDCLNSIREAKMCQNDLESYLEDVRNFRETLNFKMITDGRKELYQSYGSLQILNPCTWLSEAKKENTLSKYLIDKIFTPLKIEDKRSEINITDLLTITTRIKGEEKIPPALFLYGNAGCGKTSLSHFILHQWCEKKQNIVSLEDINLLIFVEVRRVKSKSLREFLREECLKDTCQDFKSDDIIPTLQDMDVLFVIDGYDEWKGGSSFELINDILCKFGDKRVIMTMRNSYLSDALLAARKYRVDNLSIEICGFDDESLKKFSEKVFRAIVPDEQKCQKEISAFQDYLDGRGSVLEDHLKLPLTTALLIYLWHEDPTIINNVTTATRLYQEIFGLCQKRLKERINYREHDKLDGVLNDLFLCLGQQAWVLLVEGNLICLTQREFSTLKSECSKKLIDVMELLSAYLCCETNLNSDSSEKIFAFLHRTQMEYLSAAYLGNALIKGNLTFENINQSVRSRSEWRRYQEVITFLGGHLAINKSLSSDYVDYIFCFLREANIGYANYQFWWNFYLETLRNVEVGCRISTGMLPRMDWQLDTVHVVPALELYLALKVNLETLKIDIPIDVNPHKIRNLQLVMSKIQNAKKKEKQKNRLTPVKVELHFWHHNEYETDQTSGIFIRSLYPWGHLTNFTGSLGEEDGLSYSYHLKTIRIRLGSVSAIACFKCSLSRIFKSVRKLRITIGIPFTCSVDEVCELSFRSFLEITLIGVKDDQVEWAQQLLSKINGR
ncbi:hypothetical protein SK128_012059, partial [Halocaridina rubra]